MLGGYIEPPRDFRRLPTASAARSVAARPGAPSLFRSSTRSSTRCQKPSSLSPHLKRSASSAANRLILRPAISALAALGGAHRDTQIGIGALTPARTCSATALIGRSRSRRGSPRAAFAAASVCAGRAAIRCLLRRRRRTGRRAGFAPALSTCPGRRRLPPVAGCARSGSSGRAKIGLQSLVYTVKLKQAKRHS